MDSIGAEAAALIASSELPPDHVFLKLNFRNTCKSIRMDKLLEATGEHIPGIPPLFASVVPLLHHLFVITITS